MTCGNALSLLNGSHLDTIFRHVKISSPRAADSSRLWGKPHLVTPHKSLMKRYAKRQFLLRLGSVFIYFAPSPSSFSDLIKSYSNNGEFELVKSLTSLAGWLSSRAFARVIHSITKKAFLCFPFLSALAGAD